MVVHVCKNSKFPCCAVVSSEHGRARRVCQVSFSLERLDELLRHTALNQGINTL